MSNIERRPDRQLIQAALRKIRGRLNNLEGQLEDLNKKREDGDNSRLNLTINTQSVHIDQFNILSSGSTQQTRPDLSGIEIIPPSVPVEPNHPDHQHQPRNQKPSPVRRSVARLATTGILLTSAVVASGVGLSVGAAKTYEYFFPQPGRGQEPSTATAAKATPTPSEAGAAPTPTLVPADKIGAESPILIGPTIPTPTPKPESTATTRPAATPEIQPSPTPKSDKQTDREIIHDPSGTTLKEGAIAVIKTINHNNLTITIEAIKLSESKTLVAPDKDSLIEEEGSHGYADINAAVLAACKILQETRQSLQSNPSSYLPPSPLSRYKVALNAEGYTVALPPDCKPQ